MPNLLATQSHVCHGYVGNKAATFPLQCLGWDVDCCNTVQFSNHTGYGLDRVFGGITSDEQLNDLLKDLLSKEKGFNYSALLSGYLPNSKSVRCMGQNYVDYKSNSKSDSNAIWLLDPVMGDEGQVYVDEDVIPVYRKIVFETEKNIIDIITPNQFEVELLCDRKIKNLEDLKKCIDILRKHIGTVIVTSCESSLIGGDPEDSNSIFCVVSSEYNDIEDDLLIFKVPLIKSYFTGVGDLFSAMILDRIYKFKKNSNIAGEKRQPFYSMINKVLDILQEVLRKTQEYAPKDFVSRINSPQEMKLMELRLIESKSYFNDDPAKNDYRYKKVIN